MKKLILLVALAVVLVAPSAKADLLSDNYRLLFPRVDSWPGQPGNPGGGFPPTTPPTVPPTYPPTTPGYPGNGGGYQSAYQLFTRGQAAYNQGNLYNAIQLFQRLLNQYPYDTNAPMACYLTAESYRLLNNFYNAITYYQKVSISYPTFTQADRATYYIGFCKVKLNDYYGAINEFRNFIARFPMSQLIDDAFYVMGRTYENLGDNQNAIDAYEKVIYNYPNSDYYSKCRERLSLLKPDATYPDMNPTPPEYPIPPGNSNPGLSDLELFNRGHSELLKGNTDNAVTYFNELLKRYPASIYADDALLWKGKAYLQRQSYLQAIDAFELFMRTYTYSDLYPEAVYTLAYSEFQQGKQNVTFRQYFVRAAQHFAYFQQNYPVHKWASEALFAAGECYENLGDYHTARGYFQQIVDQYPNTSTAQKAREKLNNTY